LTLVLVLVASLAVTWTWSLRGGRPNPARLCLIAVRGVAVLTLSLWVFYGR
jgi:hypothetical protein